MDKLWHADFTWNALAECALQYLDTDPRFFDQDGCFEFCGVIVFYTRCPDYFIIEAQGEIKEWSRDEATFH